MMKKWVLGVLFLSLVLAACSPSEEVTGNAVVDSQASLLQVHVIDEDGEIVDGASIYVNNVLKGKTSKYGENKGSKIVILKGERNSITVEKEGFFLSPPTSVSASKHHYAKDGGPVVYERIGIIRIVSYLTYTYIYHY